MDFLRRLAPSRVDDASRAVPRLVSRFAGDAATSLSQRLGLEAASAMPGPPPVPASPPQRERSAPAADRPPPWPIPAEPHETPRGVAVSDLHRDAPTEALRERAPGGAALANVSDRVDRANPDDDAIAPSAGTRPLRRVDMDALMPMSMNSAVTAAGIARPAPPPAPPPAQAAPISAAAIETLTAARVPPRPVIHVTIDRIDVRAPATAPRAVSASRPRNSMAPGVSLADYLRAGPRRRDGGES